MDTKMMIEAADGSVISGYRVSTLKIVSSGYGDRYVQGDTYLHVDVGGASMRIDFENDRVPVLVRIAGYTMQNVPDGVFQECVKMAHHSPMATWITYHPTEYETRTIKTAYSKIEAGIHAATNYAGLNDHGKSRFEPISKTLTADEWGAIRYGLQRINERHSKTGKPVVEFTIPTMEA
jgi:hypothetical protein